MMVISGVLPHFFFQAEDGIRDWSVTGVQTCALPISSITPSPERDSARSRSSIRRMNRSTMGESSTTHTTTTSRPLQKPEFSEDSVALGLDRKSVVEGKSVDVGGGLCTETSEKVRVG